MNTEPQSTSLLAAELNLHVLEAIADHGGGSGPAQGYRFEQELNSVSRVGVIERLSVMQKPVACNGRYEGHTLILTCSEDLTEEQRGIHAMRMRSVDKGGGWIGRVASLRRNSPAALLRVQTRTAVKDYSAGAIERWWQDYLAVGLRLYIDDIDSDATNIALKLTVEPDPGPAR